MVYHVSLYLYHILCISLFTSGSRMSDKQSISHCIFPIDSRKDSSNFEEEIGLLWESVMTLNVDNRGGNETSREGFKKLQQGVDEVVDLNVDRAMVSVVKRLLGVKVPGGEGSCSEWYKCF